MVLGMPVATFVAIHTVISLIALVIGIKFAADLAKGKESAPLTLAFLATTALITMTGFMLPFVTLLPSHIFGFISVVALAAVIPAYYNFNVRGFWRRVFVAGALLLFYLNAFVAIVQGFLKLPFLNALAPTASTEPPFAVAQLALLVVMVWLGLRAMKRYQPAI